MSKFIFAAAFAVGAVAIVWIGRLFLGTEILGLTVTLIIGAVYALGTYDLLGFRRATGSLQTKLHNTNTSVSDLNAWLEGIDSSLQNSVRARIEGVRAVLPAPVLTPYLVGLLVMLGLLGTFIGMVDTLKGAVVALEGENELEAIRQGLAAPIEGLGLAFGTSVAGVAASAMLGLLSTLCRRERLLTSQALDQKSSQYLTDFSANHQQRMAFTAIQQQALALPAVAEKLTTLTDNLAQLSERLGQNLLDNQAAFQTELGHKFNAMTESVGASLENSLIQGAKHMNDTLLPLAEKTFEHVRSQAERTHQGLTDSGLAQQEALSASVSVCVAELARSVESVNQVQADQLHDVLGELKSAVTSITAQLHQHSEATSLSLSKLGESWLEQQKQGAQNVAETMRGEFVLLREQEAQRLNTAVDKMAELQTAVAEHLSTLGSALEAPMTRLIETASETPKAAADVIEKLRKEVSNNLERDNELVAERTRLLSQFDEMSRELQANSSGQREAVEAMIERTSHTLNELTEQFSEQVRNETGKMSNVAEHFAASSAEMASLGDAFMASVTSFNESNQALMSHLQNIEAALEKSSNRSDEQLAYYVAQAREIIDHNLLSHQQIIAALNQKRPEQLAVEEVG